MIIVIVILKRLNRIIRGIDKRKPATLFLIEIPLDASIALERRQNSMIPQQRKPISIGWESKGM